MKRLLSIVIPCFNEEAVIHETYRQLDEFQPGEGIDKELIFVNDGSRDDTGAILESIARASKGVRVLNLSRNFGHQMAISAGINNASGDAIVIIDADLQDPIYVIAAMVEKWQQGFDIVYGRRIDRKGESWFKKRTSSVYYKLLYRLSDVAIPTDVGDFRLIDRKVADALKQMPERSRYVRGLIAWLGFSTADIEYIREPRFAGETKYPFSRMLKLALDGIFSFSYKPLKLASLFGVSVSAISFLYLIYVLVQKFVHNNTVSGWASLMVVLLFMSGILLSILGIIGEYIARIYEEVKARPLYVIREEVNGNDEEKS